MNEAPEDTARRRSGSAGASKVR